MSVTDPQLETSWGISFPLKINPREMCCRGRRILQRQSFCFHHLSLRNLWGELPQEPGIPTNQVCALGLCSIFWVSCRHGPGFWGKEGCGQGQGSAGERMRAQADVDGAALRGGRQSQCHLSHLWQLDVVSRQFSIFQPSQLATDPVNIFLGFCGEGWILSHQNIDMNLLGVIRTSFRRTSLLVLFVLLPRAEF